MGGGKWERVVKGTLRVESSVVDQLEGDVDSHVNDTRRVVRGNRVSLTVCNGV